MNQASVPWYRELTRYHWFVLAVAALGWMFDCLDQQLFVLARAPAMQELLAPTPGVKADPQVVDKFGGYATSIFLIGWATGGLTFGVMGDRIGRAKTMLWTILLYSAFTGLSALSVGFADFALYRFLTGVGVGGEFAVGVSLVAEVIPDRARPFALALLQALSAIGNISAALINMLLGRLESAGVFENLSLPGLGHVGVWRLMFVIGIAPALLAAIIRRRLKEPERWQTVAQGESGAARLGSYSQLFGDPRWRRRAIVGMLLAAAGIIGLWGIVFFTYELVRSVLGKTLQAEGMAPADLSGELKYWTGIASVMINLGAFCGMFGFGYLTDRIGRRWALAIAFVAAMLSTALVFSCWQTRAQIFWMFPLMGCCQLALFSGYAIYFPELFPTYLRSTGTSFCYNVGRYVAALGPSALGLLTAQVYASQQEPLRYAGVTMCSVFILGLLVLPFAPETKGLPLPE